MSEPDDERIGWGLSHSFTDSVLWPDPKRGPWRVRCTWSDVSGYARLTGIAIESRLVQKGRTVTVEPITATVYRQLPLLAVAEQVLQKIREKQREFIVGPYEGEGDVVGRHTHGGKTGRPRGTTTTPTVEEAAEVYLRCARQGSSSPTVDVANELNISRSAAAKRVARAREAGLLPATTQGTAVPVVKKLSKKSVTKRPASRKGAR